MLTSSAMYSSDHSLSFTVAEPSLTAALQSESHSLFAQLRKHYPAGALLSELVQIHDGQFVVRALVQVGTATLATAMAAADRVEEAEDRARVRAMAVLGISPAVGRTPLMPPTFEVQGQPLMKESLKEQGIPDALSSVESRVESMLPEVEETPEVVEPAKKSSRRKKEKEEVSAESDLLSFSGFDSFESLPEPVEDDYSSESQSEPEYSEKPLQAETDADEPMKETLPDLSSEPIDLSDAIAQIGTEIERIGWTKKQGSTYLQQTYSKKTRAELTEDELLEFLHYLKALPSKGHPSLNQLPF
ncbi:MAG: hypothetical protein KME13_11070 [Myxacorys californica WJT36-NPBG1]|nr:hypothetical protein [Myxacorys californica WJT36-NPBG1]